MAIEHRRSSKGRDSVLMPSMYTAPFIAGTVLNNPRRSDDLPEPVRPTKAHRCPAGMVKVIPRSTGSKPSAYRSHRSFISTVPCSGHRAGNPAGLGGGDNNSWAIAEPELRSVYNKRTSGSCSHCPSLISASRALDGLGRDKGGAKTETETEGEAQEEEEEEAVEGRSCCFCSVNAAEPCTEPGAEAVALCKREGGKE